MDVGWWGRTDRRQLKAAHVPFDPHSIHVLDYVCVRICVFDCKDLKYFICPSRFVSFGKNIFKFCHTDQLANFVLWIFSSSIYMGWVYVMPYFISIFKRNIYWSELGCGVNYVVYAMCNIWKKLQPLFGTPPFGTYNKPIKYSRIHEI